MIYYCQKEINPLKVKISKIIFDEQNKENMEAYNRFSLMQFKNIKKDEKGKGNKGNIISKKKKEKYYYPPKKQMAKKGSTLSGGDGFIVKQTEESNSKGEVFESNNKNNLKGKPIQIIPNSILSNNPHIKNNPLIVI